MNKSFRNKIFPMENFRPALIYDHDGNLSDRWYVFYFFKDPDTGSYIRFKDYISSKFKTKTERYLRGKEMVDQINKRLREGFNPFASSDPKNTNILEAIKYIKDSQISLRKRTRHTYDCLLRRFEEFLTDGRFGFHRLTIEEFNYVHAQKFLDWYRKKHKVENRTYNYAIMHMKGFFNLLIEREWIMVNPFKKVKPLPVEDTEIIAFTEADLKILREELPEYNYDLFIVAGLIYYCFLRPAEIMRLQVYHFHINEGFISVPGNVSKNKRQSIIDIPDNFMDDLKKLDLNYDGDNYVFARHLQRGIKEAAPTRIAGYWREFADKFGIKKNIYALKHTGNGRASEMGMTTRDLQLHNRHSDLGMTQRYLDRFSRKPTTQFVKTFPKL
jgi:integrase/recombinase XerD